MSQTEKAKPYETLYRYLEECGVSPQSTHQIVRAIWLTAVYGVRDLRMQNEFEKMIEEVKKKIDGV